MIPVLIAFIAGKAAAFWLAYMVLERLREEIDSEEVPDSSDPVWQAEADRHDAECAWPTKMCSCGLYEN